MLIHILATHVGYIIITHCREQREKGWNEEWERVQQIIHELLVLQSTGGGWVWHERLDNMMYTYIVRTWEVDYIHTYIHAHHARPTLLHTASSYLPYL